MSSSKPPTAKNLHHEKLPIWPDFAIADEKIDGLVPACQVESWQELVTALNGGKHDHTGEEMIYRGHRRFDWQLESTLTRQFDGGSIPPGMSDLLHKKFLLAMRGRGNDLSKEDTNEIWAYGQHFGLATPLLDWTESPFVALFFAFSKEDSSFDTPNPSRALFRLNRTLLSDLLEDSFFEPSLGENARLVNQAGLFTVTPSDEDNLVSAIINEVIENGAIDPNDANQLGRYICKIHIPNSDRSACLNMLRKMNIHHANLFPDPSGASEFCNDWLSRTVDERRVEALARKKSEERAKHPPIKISDLLSRTEDDSTLVEELLTEALPDNTEIEAGTISEWASKIDAMYQANAPLDWPTQPASRANITIALKRLLSLLGFSKAYRETIVKNLISFYAAKYAANQSKEAD